MDHQYIQLKIELIAITIFIDCTVFIQFQTKLLLKYFD